MDNKKNIEADKITINKTTKDEENVKIDINKKEKKVEVNVNKNGTNEKIQIGLKGIKIKDNDGEKVNIQFGQLQDIIAKEVNRYLENS